MMPSKWDRVQAITCLLHDVMRQVSPPMEADEVLSVAAGLFQTAVVNTAHANPAPDQLADLRVQIHATLDHFARLVDQPDAAAILAVARARHEADAFAHGPAPVVS
jgi:hypothetical protein